MFEWMRAIEIDAKGQAARARAQVSGDEPQLQDHFPGRLVLPGTVAVELAAQLAGPLAEEVESQRGCERWAFLGMIRHAVFRHEIALPAQLWLEAEIVRTTSGTSEVRVEVHHDARCAVRVELVMRMLALEGVERQAALAARLRRLEQWKRAWSAS